MSGPGQAAVALPVAWLEGDVLAEYVRFLQEAALLDVKWLEGDVLDDFLEFLGEAEHAAARGSCGSNDDDLMEEEDDGDDELARLMPLIMSLPAVMARAAAAPTVKETVRQLVSNHDEGWL